ncbi:MAG: ribonuclease H-like domain-containing protein [Methanosarcinaceae archaeon]|nr:ribonuclease H-like domain-containing protein [Methanosarcinaceae archaeon]
MLTNTYIHIQGVGKTLEQKIWASGVQNWKNFREMQENIPISPAKKTRILKGIKESSERLKARDYCYFSQKLPSAEHWRTYPKFSDSMAFVDIETTGLSPNRDCVTVVGIYDGKEAKTFVKGINLDEIVDEFAKYRLLVSFNGARFDLPFIKAEYPEIEFDQLHIDLMYPLRRLGYRGGLKNIEKLLGITRSESTDGMSGFEAVRLWKKYEKGDRKALELLLEYNKEDIVNLKTIIEMTYPYMVKKTLETCKP